MSITRPGLRPTQGPGVTLHADPGSRELNGALREMYEATARRLAEEPDDVLSSRIRAYDNRQRLTFGRAQTPELPVRRFLDGVELGWFDRVPQAGRDRSYFPGSILDPALRGLGPVLNASVASILGAPADLGTDEPLMMTIFMHRVVVRPGDRYRGFFHRDLAPRHGRIGTMIWYPQLRHDLVTGLEFIAYDEPRDVPLGALRDVEPDLEIPPEVYARAAVSLRFPHNLPHGVRPGRYRHTRDTSRGEPSPQDFIAPAVTHFVKDLVIVTLSERSPVEE